jgi:hypothetical protein
MTLECILLILLTCHSKPTKLTYGLASLETSSAIYDGVTTMNLQKRGNFVEMNPYLGSHPTWSRMVPLGAGEIVATAWLGAKLRRSQGFQRHLWWLPQATAIGLHIFGAVHNSRLK